MDGVKWSEDNVSRWWTDPEATLFSTQGSGNCLWMVREDNVLPLPQSNTPKTQMVPQQQPASNPPLPLFYAFSSSPLEFSPCGLHFSGILTIRAGFQLYSLSTPHGSMATQGRFRCLWVEVGGEESLTTIWSLGKANFHCKS